jgi:amino acid transporter
MMPPPRPDSTSAPTPALIKVLGLWDVVAMNIVAVVGLRWIARGARVGAPSVVLWVLACVLFFIPLACALAELSSRYPDQGGIYAWARRAFGPVHGFVCGWCLWVNNLFYFPSLLLFVAANALLVFGDRFAGLADNRTYSVAFVLVTLWLLTGLNVLGLSAGKWLQNVGTAATWIPVVILIVCGAAAFASFGSATSFAPANLVPHDNVLATVSLWSAMCFAFSGFEITSMVGQEVKNPTRTIPRGVLIAGAGVMIIYIAGSASVLVAVPASALAERSGIADAVELVAGRAGLAGVGALTAGLLALGALAGTSSWIAGAARVPFAAGVDRVLPAAFSGLHARYRTPHVALLIQGLVATVLFLASVFLTVAGGHTTIQEAYDILVNLTILTYFVPYLYLFAALIALRAKSSATVRTREEMRVPGGRAGLFAVAGCGFLATVVSLALLFVPPAGTGNRLNFEVNIIAQAAIVLGIGLAFYWWSRRGG